MTRCDLHSPGFFVLMAVLVIALGAACSSTSPTSPSTPTPISPAPAPSPGPAPEAPSVTSYRVFGIVTNEEGNPLSDAAIQITYGPDGGATQRFTARAGGDGRYELSFTANQVADRSPAVIRVFADDNHRPFEQSITLLPAGLEKNVRLRPVRTITAGQSDAVTFDANSSRCSTPGTQDACEWIRVRYPDAFTEAVDVRVSGEAGATVPTLTADVRSPFQSANAPFPSLFRVVGQGVVTLRVGNGEFSDNYSSATTVDVVISIPAVSAPQRYEVTVY